MSIVSRAAAIAPAAMLWLAAAGQPLAAQGVVEPAASPEVTAEAEAAGEAGSAAATSPRIYGRIERPDTQLRCFPTSYSPIYGETLGEGDVVALTGESQNGYTKVLLPLGALGFVHSRYVAAAEDGSVSSKGSSVAFRYRTNAREAPVRFVDDGTVFKLVDRDGEWLRVRFPEQPVWVATAAVVAFPADEAVATIEAAWQDLAARQQAQIDEAAMKLQEERAAAEALDQARGEVEALSQSFRTEVAKPNAEQALEPLRASAAKLVAAIDPESDLHSTATRLLASIERQAAALEMTRILNTPKPEPTEIIAPIEVEADPLGDYATGWLKETSTFGLGRKLVLEKGGQVLFELDCRTGRYNLETYAGMEVALRGAVDRPDPDSLRRLDVRRIEVLTRRSE